MAASAYLGDLGGLAAHRQLVLLDLRGTGDSAVPADPVDVPLSTGRSDDVEALRVHLGLERIDLLGHSAGGSLAIAVRGGAPGAAGPAGPGHAGPAVRRHQAGRGGVS